LIMGKMETIEEQESVINITELLGIFINDNTKEMDNYYCTKMYELKLFEHRKNL